MAAESTGDFGGTNVYRIVRREQLSDSVFLWDVEAPDVAAAAQAGQFVMIHLHAGGERIPLTIADFDRDAGTVTLVVQAVGKTTRGMLTRYQEGDDFEDLAGPLGLPSELEAYGHVVLIGGGLGVAPIFPQLRAFKEAGNKTTAIIGFRSSELVFWEEKFKPWCDRLIVCTDDGSYGFHGFVSRALDALLTESEPVDRVVAVGPLPMMRACAEVTRPTSIPTVVSLNAIMVDGTGMCGSCRVSIGGKVNFACVDGPEFDAHQVDFPELIARQRRFQPEERTAEKDYDHVCNLERTLVAEGKRNYKKIKDLRPEAVLMPERDARSRARDFTEVNLGYSLANALEEAERCIQCAKPKCVSGCPVGVDIPGFIRQLLVRDLDQALAVINKDNLFPSICGRVCPQESQCEAQCIIGKKVEPVAIGRLERFVGDHATAPQPKPAREDHIGRVAIVGSGPGGLACAADLAQHGVDVTVYEALHVVGGVLAYGIPPFRLPRDIISREIERLKGMGVKLETNKVVGRTFTLAEMTGKMGFDAVFVATGAGYPWFLGIPGEHAGRVYSANEFLTRINLMGGDQFPLEDTPVSLGNKVVVIGAGNTGMDCLRVARRLGATDVHCVYRRSRAEAPARAEELRHAMEEGIQFHWLRSPLEILVDARGDVRAMRCQMMELGPPDDSGRRRPVVLEGQEQVIECDTVIYALGTQANPIIGQTTPGLETRRGGYIVVDESTQATNLPGVFAGGDIVTGGATVILAMGAGRRAAAGVQAWLSQRTWPPALEAPAPPEEKKRARRAATPVCPRCGRPTADGEEYVCCAEAPLTWQCGGCGKVSEGFAFPYGLCPNCGGSLTLGHDPATEGEDPQQAIRRAFEIELGGRGFYTMGASRVHEPALKELFGKLATMEEGHMRTLSRRYHVTPPPAELAPNPEQVAIYAGYQAPVATGEDLLKLAIHLEERARDFFAGQRGALTEGSDAWKLYQELEAEEQEHVDLLTTELERLVQRRPGLL